MQSELGLWRWQGSLVLYGGAGKKLLATGRALVSSVEGDAGSRRLGWTDGSGRRWSLAFDETSALLGLAQSLLLLDEDGEEFLLAEGVGEPAKAGDPVQLELSEFLIETVPLPSLTVALALLTLGRE